MSITTIIVTFNREALIERCLKAVIEQSYKPKNILVINNASTDGTEERLKLATESNTDTNAKETLIKLNEINGVSIYLYNKEKNTGGSGGFNKGMEVAEKQLCADYYWMMDDDGYPSEECLDKLIKTATEKKCDYLMPVSIDIDNHKQLSWAMRKKNGKKTISYDEIKKSWGDIWNYVTPFNGVLLSADCVSKVGYINKDFFIWGDEYEHYWRCRKAGYFPITDLNAQFYHPAAKLPLVPIVGGLMNVPFVDSPMRMICYVRNHTYIYLHYHGKWKIAARMLMYTWLYVITRKGDWKYLRLYFQSVKDGFKGNFTRHLKYMK